MNGKISAFAPGRICGYVLSRPLVRDMVTTTIFSTIGKGVGFLIPFFIAAWFGVSSQTDAFFFAYGLILLITGIFAPVVESIIVPFIAEIKANDEAEVKPFLGTILVLTTVGLVLSGCLFLLVSRPILGAVTTFSQESIDLIFRLIIETIPLLGLLVGTSLLSGALNAYRFFWLPAISPAFRAILTLLIIFILKDRIGVHSIAIGYVIGELFRFLILFSEAAKRGIIRFNISIDLNPKIFGFLRTSFYQVMGMMVLAFNPVVDKTMASWLGPGSVSTLEYADRLYHVPTTLISYGLFVVLLSHWSDELHQYGQAAFRQKVINTAKVVGGGALLFSIILILFRSSLVNLVYGYGKFPAQYVTPVSDIWGLYLIGFAPTILGLVFARAHLVGKNTKVFMYLGTLNCILNILLNLALIGPFGINGLALATTLTYSVVSMGLCLTFLKSRTV